MKNLLLYINIHCTLLLLWTGQLSRYSDWLRAGPSRIESPWERYFPPVQTGPGAHPASCKMGTGSFPGVKCGWGVLLTTHHFECYGHGRVELYLYPPSGPHRACNGITLTLCIIIIIVSCHRVVLPRTSPLEPTVIPNTQALSFCLHNFPYFRPLPPTPNFPFMKKLYPALSSLGVFTFCTCCILICLVCFVASFKLSFV